MVQDMKADKVSQGKSSVVGLCVLFDGAWGFASTDVVAEIQPIVDTGGRKWERAR